MEAQTKKRPEFVLDAGEMIGGQHYKGFVMQPAEYAYWNNLGFCEASVVKYVTRWRQKGGVEDLKKARHFIEMLIQLAQADR